MMTNEEILKEVKNTFRLEGIVVTKEQEERIIKLLTGEVDLETLINDLKHKYTHY